LQYVVELFEVFNLITNDFTDVFLGPVQRRLCILKFANSQRGLCLRQSTLDARRSTVAVVSLHQSPL